MPVRVGLTWMRWGDNCPPRRVGHRVCHRRGSRSTPGNAGRGLRVLAIERATSARDIQAGSRPHHAGGTGDRRLSMSTPHKRRSRAARTWIATVGGIAAVTLVLAGCGDGASGGSYGSAPAAGSSGSSGGSSVALAGSKLGDILVDGKGRTLYLFEADKGPTSVCDGACATAWPPLTTTGTPKAGTGVSAAKLGTTKRDDGT